MNTTETTKNIPLTKDMVEVRIGTLTSTPHGYRGNLLIYQDARASMNVLDTLYPGWQRLHQEIGGQIFCTLSVFDNERKTWISRTDVGTAGDFEKEKSAVTDSFKRAATNFIPAFRALYKAPAIYIPLSDKEVSEGSNGKLRCYTKFTIADIAYDEQTQTFTALKIVDGNGEVRYDLNKTTDTSTHEGATTVKPRVTSTATYNNGCTCAECGAKISDKVAIFSLSKYKKHLCMNCQKHTQMAA